MNRSKLLLWTIVLGLLSPTLGSAESPVDGVLAPPGPCAEPREQALRADPIYSTATEDAEAAPVFAIAGSPRDHFDPVDVAGGAPTNPAFSPPAPLAFDRTPCSSPDAGCRNLLDAGLGLTESLIQGGTGGPPGVPGGQP